MSAEVPAIDEGQRELDIRVGLGIFASEAQLEHLLGIARQVDVEAGETLFARDAPVATLFQVITGELEMRAPDKASWRIAGAGTVGFVDFMLGRHHGRTAITTTPVRLIELDATDYRDYLEDNFDVSHRILAHLSGELINDAVSRPEAPQVLATPAAPRERSIAAVEIPMVERLMMLSRMPAFAGASTQGLADLAQAAAEVRLPGGTVLAAAGSRPTVVSILIEGEVQLELPSGVQVTRAGRCLAAHVEELATTARLTTVTAMSPVILLQLERELLLDRFEENFDLVMSLFGFLAREQEILNDLAAATGQPLATDWR
ncbi:MAG: cyclic nucleotide-binding domain-containing protein [Deltaproteobacteria bacterium]|nr:cyclic nucleotide-binding domain-containing protein [Deltaproteobacteria bacterium]MDQ3295226.1 cyclic nucleotide-binding domain-containing protein [Myxococcota bacterium]